MVIDFTEQEIAALIELLGRVQIQGREAPAIIALMQKLQPQPEYVVAEVAPNGTEPHDDS